MNMVEKILAKAANKKQVAPGDVIVANVDLMVMHDLSSNLVMKVIETEMENASIQDPSRIAFVFDHNFSPASQLAAETLAAVRKFAARHGIRHVFDGGTGSVHHCIIEAICLLGSLTCAFLSIDAYRHSKRFVQRDYIRKRIRVKV